MLVASEKLSSDRHTQNWLTELKGLQKNSSYGLARHDCAESVSITYSFPWFCDTIILWPDASCRNGSLVSHRPVMCPPWGQSHCHPQCQVWLGIVKLKEWFICILRGQPSIFCCQKILSFLQGQTKQEWTWMVDYRGRRDSGTGRTFCEGEGWSWQVIGQHGANTAPAFRASSAAARSPPTSQHRIVASWLH